MLLRRRFVGMFCFVLLLLPALAGCGEEPERAEKDNMASSAAVFSAEEVAAAEAVLAEYERTFNAKDREGHLKTRTEWYDHPNVILWEGNETLSLEITSYDPEDPDRGAYVNYHDNEVKPENVIVFRTNYTLTYPEGEESHSMSGSSVDKRTGWMMVLIREDKDSPWLIDDMGY